MNDPSAAAGTPADGSSATTLDALNAAPPDAFTEALADIFENSPWVARAVAGARPFADLAALHAAMVAAIDAAPQEIRLELIRAHPDLAGRAAVAGELTERSRDEQSGAGLDRLEPAEFARFQSLNRRYRERFGFPFVIAVRGHTKHSILAAFERRLEHDPAAERDEALRQIARIGRFRLEALLGGAR